MQFFALLRQAPRPLAFGAVHSFGSAFGQTFLVALFVPFIAKSLGINETQFANIYAGITIGSACTLPFIGRLIDRMDMLRYSLMVMAILAVGCFAMAASASMIGLIAALYILRLAGQGLMTHVSMTSIARYFDRNRGRALAISNFGFPVAEAIMPMSLLALIGMFGWRPVYAGAGVLIIAILMPLAIWLIRDNQRFRAIPQKEDVSDSAPTAALPNADDGPDHPRLFRSTYIWLAMPMLAAPPLVMTALFFHQSVIAEHKHIDLGWFAMGFTVFAVTSVLGTFGSGPLVDKYSARRLFPYHMLPSMIGILLLMLFDTPWIVPVYMAMVGFTTGSANTIRGAIVPELVPLDEIGAVRSTLTAVMVVSSAGGPAIYGWMLAANMDIANILGLTLIGMVGASVLSWFAERPGFYVPPGVARHANH
jgi:MFS family permease